MVDVTNHVFQIVVYRFDNDQSIVNRRRIFGFVCTEELWVISVRCTRTCCVLSNLTMNISQFDLCHIPALINSC